MIDAKRLLVDLKKLRKRWDTDLRQFHEASLGRAAAEAEWQAALAARRTADTFETFWTTALDQAAVHWILALVFIRFLEDNRLLDRPMLAGAGERGELALERQRAFFRARPHDSDAEYLLDCVEQAARLPGLAGLFNPAHNPLFRLSVSGDAAMALLAFFRERTDRGGLVHDFADEDWDTRFLGDLYQDLSEYARKRFALLQTPDFVESWILDRTLDPAIGEFGWDRVRMIDPACGSGHFLLGGFARLLALCQHHAPELPAAAQAQRALDAVSGVDLNPFAVEIARFRLLLAALRAAEETRLAAAPDFRFSLAVGDSLLHGTHFFRHELGGTEGFRRRARHHYAAEDDAALQAILGRQYHAVVGNPPYITPKDAAMRDAYRDIYVSCHREYGLGAPFTERFFDLAQTGTQEQVAGFVGLIVANNFMKREFGAKLIEAVLPRLDLTHVVDCSGAYIPGHGTPTAILFGRNRASMASVVRTVRGIRGEPQTPDNPAQGVVWLAIIAQTDLDCSTSNFISTEDTSRKTLAQHPWNLGGGGAAEVQKLIEKNRLALGNIIDQVGFSIITGADDVFVLGAQADLMRITSTFGKPFVLGEDVRDYRVTPSLASVWLYNSNFEPSDLDFTTPMYRYMWRYRTNLSNRKVFGQPILGSGLKWFEIREINLSKQRIPYSITFAFIATHNHFVFDRGGKVFKQSAPVIKLSVGASESDHLGLVGLLNSSLACFWLKQISHNKGSTVDDRGARQRTSPFEDFYEFTGTGLQRFPIAPILPLDLACSLDTEARHLSANVPAAICARAVPLRNALDVARAKAEAARARMVALQEELDWRCYCLYGLLDDAPEHPVPPPLQLGERAFEIVMARQMAAGTLDTTWFTRHRSKPITELPAHWPENYRAVVLRRIALIEADATIGLIERPEYKRRWATQPWEDGERDALRTWLLDRLESPHYWPPGAPQITSTRDLAELARRDADFLAVAGLYAATEAVDLNALVAGLVTREAVPFLACLRYTEAGVRKRADWEATWNQQRAEDAIDASAANPTEAMRRKAAEVGVIPVPPKYRTPDFQHVDFWRLRGGLDVPKERFVSYPHCARGADGTLPMLWAGHDRLVQANAVAAWYVERKDMDDWAPPRLAPLLAGLLELIPWLQQWHNGIDGESGLRMGDYYADFVADEARELGLTLDELRAWTPPAPIRRPRAERAAA